MLLTPVHWEPSTGSSNEPSTPYRISCLAKRLRSARREDLS